MEIIPKGYVNDLDLIIIFSKKDNLYTHICNRRPQAKKYIFIIQSFSSINSKYYMLFDEVIEFDFN